MLEFFLVSVISRVVFVIGFVERLKIVGSSCELSICERKGCIFECADTLYLVYLGFTFYSRFY